MIHTDLKLYCCPKTYSNSRECGYFNSRSDFPILPLDRTFNIVQNLRYCAKPFYKNTFGHWVSVDSSKKGYYEGSIEFDVSAPLLCPEDLHNCWVWVDCVSQFCTLMLKWSQEKTMFSLDRHPVEGSLFLHEQDQESVSLHDSTYNSEKKIVTIDQEIIKPFYITYRPCLLMRVCSIEQRIKEDDGSSRWKIDLEEMNY